MPRKESAAREDREGDAQASSTAIGARRWQDLAQQDVARTVPRARAARRTPPARARASRCGSPARWRGVDHADARMVFTATARSRRAPAGRADRRKRHQHVIARITISSTRPPRYPAYSPAARRWRAQRRRAEPHQQRQPRTDQRAREHVAAEVVGAEPVRELGGFNRCMICISSYGYGTIHGAAIASTTMTQTIAAPQTSDGECASGARAPAPAALRQLRAPP